MSKAVLERLFVRRRLASNELPLLESCELGRDLTTNVVVDERLDRTLGKDQADHRRRIDDRPLVVGKLVEARCQQRMDRRGDRDPAQVAGWFPATVDQAKHAGVDEHRDELLDEERVALGSGDHLGPRRR